MTLLPTQVFAFPDPLARILIYTAKVVLVIITITLLVKAIRKNIFFSGTDAEEKLYNALPFLFILMTLASPIVWEHHAPGISTENL